MRALLLLVLWSLPAAVRADIAPIAPPGFPAHLNTRENVELLWDWQRLVTMRWYAQMEHWCYATDRIPPAPGRPDVRAAQQREQLVSLLGEAPVSMFERYQVVALPCGKVRDEGRYRRLFAEFLDRVDARLAERARGGAN